MQNANSIAATVDYYQTTKPLQIQRKSNGRVKNCGSLRTNAIVRKVGVCKSGWCQVATPGGACSGWGWMFLGYDYKNAKRYRVPAGRRVVAQSSNPRAQVTTTAPAQPSVTTGSTQSPSINSEIVSAGPSNRTAPDLHIPAVNRPSRAREFIHDCKLNGISESLCRQVTYPSKQPKSMAQFARTYPGSPHLLIPPKSDWRKGILLLKAVQQAGGCSTKTVRNWYRPEPYNTRVKGAAGSAHKSASAVDIDYCSEADKCAALKKMKQLRASTGTPKGIGQYSDSPQTLHIDFIERDYGPSGCR